MKGVKKRFAILILAVGMVTGSTSVFAGFPVSDVGTWGHIATLTGVSSTYYAETIANWASQIMRMGTEIQNQYEQIQQLGERIRITGDPMSYVTGVNEGIMTIDGVTDSLDRLIKHAKDYNYDDPEYQTLYGSWNTRTGFWSPPVDPLFRNKTMDSTIFNYNQTTGRVRDIKENILSLKQSLGSLIDHAGTESQIAKQKEGMKMLDQQYDTAVKEQEQAAHQVAIQKQRNEEFQERRQHEFIKYHDTQKDNDAKIIAEMQKNI